MYHLFHPFKSNFSELVSGTSFCWRLWTWEVWFCFYLKAFLLSFPSSFCSQMCKLSFHFMKVCHNFCLSFQNGKSVISIRGKGMALLLHPHSPTVPESQKSNPIQSFSHWLNSSGWPNSLHQLGSYQYL